MEAESSPGKDSPPSPQVIVLGIWPFLCATCRDAGGEQEEGMVLNPGCTSSRAVTCVRRVSTWPGARLAAVLSRWPICFPTVWRIAGHGLFFFLSRQGCRSPESSPESSPDHPACLWQNAVAPNEFLTTQKK